MPIQTECKRCGRPCQGGKGNPEARLLKRSDKGYCADCALTAFLKTTEPLNMLIASQGVGALRYPQIRQQIARLLIVGKSDANINEIRIERVIENWDLPVRK
jgi:hypothetical protein